MRSTVAVASLLLLSACLSSGGEPPPSSCGNGAVESGELCDAGERNGMSGAGCSTGCRSGVCGDGVAAGPELCDEGRATPTCDELCRLPCGNGRLDEGEACDPTAAPDSPATCEPACVRPRSCGDGLLGPDERCDPGAAPWSAATCLDGCARVAPCGDGFVAMDEACDPVAPGWTAESCLQDCAAATPCGNDRINDGESCDDGGASATCDAACSFIEPCAATDAVIGWTSLFLRRADGVLVASGLDSDGELSGPTASGGSVLLPAEIPEEVPLVSMAQGEHAGAGIDVDGGLWTWGSNASGQRGLGVAEPAPAPGRTRVPLAVDAKAVAVGYTNVWVVGTDGSLWSFGLDQSGALGIPVDALPGLLQHCPNGDCVLTPQRIGPTDVKFVRVDGFHSSAVALDERGRLWGWGYSAAGNLGPPTGAQVGLCAGALAASAPCEPEPKLVVPDLEGIVAASAGAGQTAFVRAGRLWGLGNYFQLGLPERDGAGSIQTSEPALLGAAGDEAQGRFVGVGLGELAGLAWTDDGRLFAFGSLLRSAFGAPLAGTEELRQPLAQLPLDAGAVRAADVSWGHSFVLLRDGRLLTMGGYAENGRLGREAASALTPTAVTSCP